MADEDRSALTRGTIGIESNCHRSDGLGGTIIGTQKSEDKAADARTDDQRFDQPRLKPGGCAKKEQPIAQSNIPIYHLL
jgi:hypothetical protein